MDGRGRQPGRDGHPVVVDVRGLHVGRHRQVGRAPLDQGVSHWGCPGVDLAEIANLADGDTHAEAGGARNTDAIIARCGSDTAAGLARAYRWPHGQADGYLPNRDELGKLHAYHTTVGGFTSLYWSSSEFADDLAWHHVFDLGMQPVTTKDSPLAVRAIRAF